MCQWISVEERLPKGGDSVLAMAVPGRPFAALKTPEGWRTRDAASVSSLAGITHWMPIHPLPPKPDPVREALRLAKYAIEVFRERSEIAHCGNCMIPGKDALDAIARAEAELDKRTKG